MIIMVMTLMVLDVNVDIDKLAYVKLCIWAEFTS